MLFRLIVVALLMVSSAAPAIGFTMAGSTWTSRDEALFLKMLNALAEFSRSRYGCNEISGIYSEILPDHQLSGPPPDIAVGQLHHERWTVGMCGKKREFIFTLFGTRNGGTGWVHTVPD